MSSAPLEPAELTVTRKAGGHDGARYAVRTPDGRVYEVAKEFYADGPSMFTWVVTGTAGPHCPTQVEEWSEHSTKKVALRHVSFLPTP